MNNGSGAKPRPADVPRSDAASEFGYVSRRRSAQAPPQSRPEPQVRPEPQLRPEPQSRPEPQPEHVRHEPPREVQARPERPQTAHRAQPPRRPDSRASGKNTAHTAARRKNVKLVPRGTKRRRRVIAREAGIWIATLAVALLLAFGIRTWVFSIVRVEGPSMNPTLQSDELLFVTKFDYLFSAPARGDVVVCRFPNRDGTFVKRVIGVPGDTVQIIDGSTYVNEVLLDESFISYAAAEDYGPVLVGDGQYMVMGDNRAISHDSRSDDVGTLQADAIIGRARSVIYPFGEYRSVAG